MLPLFKAQIELENEVCALFVRANLSLTACCQKAARDTLWLNWLHVASRHPVDICFLDITRDGQPFTPTCPQDSLSPKLGKVLGVHVYQEAYCIYIVLPHTV